MLRFPRRLERWMAGLALGISLGCRLHGVKPASPGEDRPPSEQADRSRPSRKAARAASVEGGERSASSSSAGPMRRDNSMNSAQAAAEGFPAWRAAPTPLAEALARVGLRADQLRIDPDDSSYFGGGLHRQQLWGSFLSEPLKIEPNVRIFRKTLLDGAASSAPLVSFGTVRLREGVRRGLIGSPLRDARRRASAPRPLAAVIEALDAQGGRVLTPAQRRDLERAASRVPDSVARPAAMLIHAMRQAADWRERALRDLSPAERIAAHADLLNAAGKIDVDDEAFAPLAEGLEARLDLKALYAGATDLALALDAAIEGVPAQPATQAGPDGEPSEPALPAIPGLRELSGPLPAARERVDAPTEFSALSFRAETPFGAIVISGGGDDWHSGRTLLVIDTGGDDSYFAAAATWDGSSPISIVIDLSGNDTYSPSGTARAAEKGARGGPQTKTGVARGALAAGQSAQSGAPEGGPSSGAGVLGYGYLVDLGGNDRYAGGGPLSQGAGLFGVGVLLDRAGDDRYLANVGTQGAGLYGVGILSDLAGDDVYECGQLGQGMGYVKGLGLLIDSSGRDRYTANDVSIQFPSPQSPQHNTSLAQGVGFGRRADFSDGRSLAGGIGMLVDGQGDDDYSAGVFAQGAGYWYGVGVLVDVAGNDRYHGVWYVQGSAAHFGVGALIDESGDDHYRGTMNMAQGAGHDFSFGELIDESGDDRYDAPNLSLGGGNDNGIGLFWDRGGRDVYQVTAETTLGRANISLPRGGLRDRMLCLGLFLDTGGGEDSYSKPFARNETGWVQRGLDAGSPLEAEKGVGLDR